MTRAPQQRSVFPVYVRAKDLIRIDLFIFLRIKIYHDIVLNRTFLA